MPAGPVARPIPLIAPVMEAVITSAPQARGGQSVASASAGEPKKTGKQERTAFLPGRYPTGGGLRSANPL